MSEQSLYWHDYETFGIDPRRDRPSQFAGVRTDMDFNIIDDPLVIYCKPPVDYLPQPEACLLTGISPQIAQNIGLIEPEFCRLIHEQFSTPNTCVLGYNTLRFDDEFTRNCLYRNFYDPYAREWQNGNSRWDLIDVVRATEALRPQGIRWPLDNEGRPIFKLEELTKANDLVHEAAHDALSDVFATIALAKLLKNSQPKLFGYLWQHKAKVQANTLLALGSYKPVVHISGRYPAANHCLAVVLPICRHPTNNNGIIVYDLSKDPEPFLSISIEDIQSRLFTATVDLPEGTERIPLKTVHTNKCPILAPVSVLKDDDLQRLDIDLASCYRTIEKIKANTTVAIKTAEVFENKEKTLSNQYDDPDLAIYSGGFYTDKDKQLMAEIRQLAPNDLLDFSRKVTSKRFIEMFFRYRARNYPETLHPDELIRWKAFCVDKLTSFYQGNTLTIDSFLTELNRLKLEKPEHQTLIREMELFAKEKMAYLGLL